MKIGDVIRFGNYDWVVVDLETDKAFLLSKEILFQQVFHLSYCDITWEHCSLREYLNTTFYNSFDEVDKTRIVKTLVVNEDNSGMELMAETIPGILSICFQLKRLPATSSEIAPSFS